MFEKVPLASVSHHQYHQDFLLLSLFLWNLLAWNFYWLVSLSGLSAFVSPAWLILSVERPVYDR